MGIKILKTTRWHRLRLIGLLLAGLTIISLAVGIAGAQPVNSVQNSLFLDLVTDFARVNDRSTGTTGAQKAARMILNRFTAAGHTTVGTQSFFSPVREKNSARIFIDTKGIAADIQPFLSNAISPDTIAVPGLEGPLVYAGKGHLPDLNGKRIKGAIVLMDMDSGNSWLHTLSLGAKALIYIQTQIADKFLYEDKTELSPVNFPRFVMTPEKAVSLFGPLNALNQPDNLLTARLTSDSAWKKVQAENIYCLIPGTDTDLEKELVVIEGFYDTNAYIPGASPGADQACSIATLIDLAVYLKKHPPARPVLLVATAAHANGLQGMRQFIAAVTGDDKLFSKQKSQLTKQIESLASDINVLSDFIRNMPIGLTGFLRIHSIVSGTIKAQIDSLDFQLVQARLEDNPDEKKIKSLARQRILYKRLEGKSESDTLSETEINVIRFITPAALKLLNQKLADANHHARQLDSVFKLREVIQDKKINACLSLHLSSHGTGIGAFNRGWMYDLKEQAYQFSPYNKLNDVLLTSAEKTASDLQSANIFSDTLRPSLQKPWESYFKDRPPLGGEVSALAGLPGVSIVSLNDARRFWNTPEDTLNRMDMQKAAQQSAFVSRMIGELLSTPVIADSKRPRNGFAQIRGRANFLRQGAVFADAPAPGSMILSFQGPGIFKTMVDEFGRFDITGVATKKISLHKVIIEGYRFDPVTGRTVWAIDKNKTSKEQYRLKITKTDMETDLVMFPCSQTTIVNLLEPRNFNFMTRLRLIDARMDAEPIKYWYSRIDTRESTICSIFLEPGTRLKLALSDTLLTNKLILTHADKRHPLGKGYRIDTTPLISPTQYLAAKDMWHLLNPRVNNLEQKSINNQQIRDLRSQGNAALKEAEQALENFKYDRFFNYSGTALALAGQVYNHVENIQKDVLYGVLFYIVLFAPFAFCLERFAFAFINIYKRIAGFLSILITLIVIIYNVHPAFELAYSPIVIILAFFIIGLSTMVTWIIYQHFENEMARLQRRGKKGNEGEISFLKALAASFFMGINNLRRRKMRTVLTCTTLVILTFTIMSFTSVKNIRQNSKILYDDSPSYHGILVKQMNWKGLMSSAFDTIENTVSDHMVAAPRAWLETADRTRPPDVPIRLGSQTFQAKGLVGLSHKETAISRFDRILSQGRWFNKEDRYAVIIPERVAQQFNLDALPPDQRFINLWSMPFKVIGSFSAEQAEKFRDLDGESLSPVIFPDEVMQKTTEAEMEAIESGEDIKAFQSRYKHIPFSQTVILPYETLISLGGNLKSIALKYQDDDAADALVFQIVNRFGLPLFSGEKKGVFLYTSSDNINYSGLPNIFIPILISMFIVLNTMVGSVQERKREIGIYTSIGMAPSHVSIIFIAEALAYAVMSVVMGYILAQVVVKVFAGTILFEGITVNYSSLGGVLAMALVMLVVLLSSIYPSRVAASIAIPDVEKSWELAKAQGDSLKIELPFLIQEKEMASICGFLYHLFDTHRAVSHGIFSVGRLALEPGKNGASDVQIHFTAWLAPFDLGVMQHVLFKARRCEHFARFMEIDLAITRQSGEGNTWWRINKRFVNLIRKQLLIWRALDESEKKGYEDRLFSTDKEAAS